MLKRQLIVPLLPAVILSYSASASEDAPHWSYHGEHGPAHWHQLSEKFSACGKGSSQSPIDLDSTLPVTSSFISKEYKPAALRIAHHEHVIDILDNGHTIQVTYDEGSEFVTNDNRYELAQFHFHAPSEHTVDGKNFPMEMHLVHSNAKGELAVIGILIAEGKHNHNFDTFFNNMPKKPGESKHLEHVNINIDDLLPSLLRYFHYSGSLTTPPCSEGVNWFVSQAPIELSAQQIAQFTAVINHNSRPVQALNGREVRLEVGGQSGEM